MSAAPGAVAIRDVLPGDLDALMALERSCFEPAQAFSRREYEDALERPFGVNLAAEEGGRLVGFVGALIHPAQRAGHILTLNVHPEHRRRGVGSALLAACEARVRSRGARRIVLEVNVGNAAAQRLYESRGYARGRRVKDYYAGYPQNDAWVYVKPLA